MGTNFQKNFQSLALNLSWYLKRGFTVLFIVQQRFGIKVTFMVTLKRPLLRQCFRWNQGEGGGEQWGSWLNGGGGRDRMFSPNLLFFFCFYYICEKYILWQLWVMKKRVRQILRRLDDEWLSPYATALASHAHLHQGESEFEFSGLKLFCLPWIFDVDSQKSWRFRWLTSFPHFSVGWSN